MSSQSAGRRRSNMRQYSAEDQALNMISKEAESRLAAKRAARAEAREIRLKEMEKQQRESETKQDRVYELTNEHNSVKGRQLTGSRSGSRRGSMESNESESKDVDFKLELRELEEKYKAAMMTSAQLDNEKQSLVYQVELLKDQLEEQDEGYTEIQRQYKDKCRDFDFQKRDLQSMEHELSILKQQLEIKDRLIEESGFVIVSNDRGEPVLTKNTSGAGSSNGPLPSGAVLVSQETKDFLEKAGGGTLGTAISDNVVHTNTISVDNKNNLPAHLAISDPSVIDRDIPDKCNFSVESNAHFVNDAGDASFLLNAPKQSENATGIDQEGLESMHDSSSVVSTNVTVTNEHGVSVVSDLGVGLDSQFVSGSTLGVKRSKSLRASATDDSDEGDEFYDAVTTPSPNDKFASFEVGETLLAKSSRDELRVLDSKAGKGSCEDASTMELQGVTTTESNSEMICVDGKTGSEAESEPATKHEKEGENVNASVDPASDLLGKKSKLDNEITDECLSNMSEVQKGEESVEIEVKGEMNHSFKQREEYGDSNNTVSVKADEQNEENIYSEKIIFRDEPENLAEAKVETVLVTGDKTMKKDYLSEGYREQQLLKGDEHVEEDISDVTSEDIEEAVFHLNEKENQYGTEASPLGNGNLSFVVEGKTQEKETKDVPTTEIEKEEACSIENVNLTEETQEETTKDVPTTEIKEEEACSIENVNFREETQEETTKDVPTTEIEKEEACETENLNLREETQEETTKDVHTTEIEKEEACETTNVNLRGETQEEKNKDVPSIGIEEEEAYLIENVNLSDVGEDLPSAHCSHIESKVHLQMEEKLMKGSEGINELEISDKLGIEGEDLISTMPEEGECGLASKDLEMNVSSKEISLDEADQVLEETTVKVKGDELSPLEMKDKDPAMEEKVCEKKYVDAVSVIECAKESTSLLEEKSNLHDKGKADPAIESHKHESVCLELNKEEHGNDVQSTEVNEEIVHTEKGTESGSNIFSKPERSLSESISEGAVSNVYDFDDIDEGLDLNENSLTGDSAEEKINSDVDNSFFEECPEVTIENMSFETKTEKKRGKEKKESKEESKKYSFFRGKKSSEEKTRASVKSETKKGKSKVDKKHKEDLSASSLSVDTLTETNAYGGSATPSKASSHDSLESDDLEGALDKQMTEKKSKKSSFFKKVFK